MGKKDSSLEDRMNRWQAQRNSPGQPAVPSKQPAKAQPVSTRPVISSPWLRRAVTTGAIVIISSSLLIGGGLYLGNKVNQAVAQNPTIQLLQTLDEVGKGIGKDVNDFGKYVSSLGFVAGTQEFVNENIVVPYNTIMPAYGNPLVIPINDVYVASDTYMVLRVDQATNQLFGDLFKVIPETTLQYNGTKPVMIYDTDETVTPAVVTQKQLKSGETVTIQGVAIEVQPRLNTGQIAVQRQAAAHISYDFSISYQKPSDMVIAPFSGKSLAELQQYLQGLGQDGIQYQLGTTLNSIDLDTQLSLTLGVPPVTVNTVPLAGTQYKDPTLNTIDHVIQQAWPIPGFSTVKDFLDYMTNMKGITSAFQQMYLNVPSWTTQAQKIPGYESLPAAVLPTISEPTADMQKVPMPEYFPRIWANSTFEDITGIYMEIVKLTVNAGVNPPIICSADIGKVATLTTSGTAQADYLQKNSIAVLPACKITENVKMTVNVPGPYVAGLQKRVDSYLSELKAGQPETYSHLQISVAPAAGK